MVSFENFVKSMTPSLLQLKVTSSFCFAFKIPDNVTATIIYIHNCARYTRVFMELLLFYSLHVYTRPAVEKYGRTMNHFFHELYFTFIYAVHTCMQYNLASVRLWNFLKGGSKINILKINYWLNELD